MINAQIELIQKLINRTLTKSQVEQLNNFELLFKTYNSHTNLMSQNDIKVLFEKHIYDSIALSLFFSKYKELNTLETTKKTNEQIKILDVGTGGGFPSIPLSIIYPEIKIYALDSIAKKIGFIELVAKELRLSNILPICKRVENLQTTDRNSFDIVTSRAVASLNVLLEYTIPFVKPNAYFVAYKARNASQELLNAQNAMNILNCKFIDSINYELPLDEDFTRELLVFKKTKATSPSYPRKTGLARKMPL